MNGMNQHLERLVDLVDPGAQWIYNMTLEEARQRVLGGTPEAVREIDGSFAIVAKHGKAVRMARSLDRPLRYFLAKRAEGPALIVAQRIDAIHQWLKREGLEDQFHPSYTRMVPAHYVTEVQLVGCPDPDPVYTRFFDPPMNALPADPGVIGRRYVAALAEAIAKWLKRVPENEPVGVLFSGGIDSGAVFLVTYHLFLKLGLNPSRLKAFTLAIGDAPDVVQAREFLERLGLGLFLEPVEVAAETIDVGETIRVVEDYKPLDIEAAAMGLALCREIRRRYPDWKYLVDGDGGDENLKDYPIEENPELTIRSVVNNRMLYQEGWGVGKIKHSLTYSGGLSRSYARSYAPGVSLGFSGFSPFTNPDVVEVAEGIPFLELTQYDVDRLYRLKGEVVGAGVESLTGFRMPIFEKRRFQHGAIRVDRLRQVLPAREANFRRQFLSLYSL